MQIQYTFNKNDEYYTPAYAVKPILKYLKPNAKIWCPFDTADSEFVKVLTEAGHDVVHSHISEENGNFFEREVPQVDYIISNPPYSLKGEVFKRLYEIGIPFAMLINFQGIFDHKERFNLFKTHRTEMMWLSPRVNYIKPDQSSPSGVPFQSGYLMTSNLDMLKYEWIWEKPMATGRLNCNFAPMKAHENILIFSKSAACYVKDKSHAMKYYPQMTEGKPYTAISGRASTNYDTKWAKEQLTVNHGTRYPRDVQKFAHDKDKFHPTQKPVALLEYLIKTYTDEGDLVLDNCMGSGSTGVAAKNTNRDFIGIELDENYFEIAKKRIEETF